MGLPSKQFEHSEAVATGGPALQLVVGRSASPRFFFVRPELLAWVYLIYPLVGLFILFDATVFKHHYQWTFPDSADELKIFLAFFGTPHVVSSLLADFDREYLTAYRRPLIAFFAVCIPVLLIPGKPALELIGSVYFIWTTYHHLSQSTGICRIMLGRVSQVYFTVWKWSLLAAFFLWMPLTRYSVAVAGLSSPGGIAFMLAVLFNLRSSWKLELFAKSAQCRLQIALTVGSLVALPLLVVSGYTFFFPICTRVVHDISAMIFYSVHDQNRAWDRPRANRLYAFLRWIPLPVYLLCPLLGVGLGLFSFPLLENDIGIRILYGIAFLHYFMEGWIWKRGSLHRRYIALGPPFA